MWVAVAVLCNLTLKGTLRNIMYYNILAVLPVIVSIISVTLKLVYLDQV